MGLGKTTQNVCNFEARALTETGVGTWRDNTASPACSSAKVKVATVDI